MAKCSFITSNCEYGSAIHGYRRSATKRMVSMLPEPGIQMGGCGCCSGRGQTFTQRKS